MNADQLIHNYVVLPPSEADLTGFKINGTMRTKEVISGSDLGKGSRWTITKKDKNDVFTFRPVEAPHMVWVWTGKLRNLQTNFCPVRDENYQI